MSHSCPECDWEHPGGAYWACKNCELAFDAFDYHSDKAGICLECRQVHVRVVCPSCEEWTRFSQWLHHEPLSTGDKVGLSAGLLLPLPVGWKAQTVLLAMASTETQERAALFGVVVAVAVIPLAVGIALQWLIDGKLSSHAKSFVTDLRGLASSEKAGPSDALDAAGLDVLGDVVGVVGDFRRQFKEQAREHIKRPPGAILFACAERGRRPR